MLYFSNNEILSTYFNSYARDSMEHHVYDVDYEFEDFYTEFCDLIDDGGIIIDDDDSVITDAFMARINVHYELLGEIG